MVAGIKREASVRKGADSITQRTVGQRFMQKWDSSPIGNEGEEESCHEEDQMVQLEVTEKALEVCMNA